MATLKSFKNHHKQMSQWGDFQNINFAFQQLDAVYYAVCVR